VIKMDWPDMYKTQNQHKTRMKAHSEFSKDILCQNGHSSGHSNEGLVIIPGGKKLAAALKSPNT